MNPALRLLAGLACVLLAGSACAQEAWVPSAETRCSLDGWASDPDPNGLNVRAEASAQAPVLGTLPPFVRNEDRPDFGVPFRILASKDGWLKISDARDDPSRSGQPQRPTYSGAGWVHGSRVRFAVQSGHGYQRPDAGSAQLLDLGDDWLSDMGRVERVIACSGDWVLVDFSLERRRNQTTQALEKRAEQERGRAWFRSVCANQETTCESP